MYINNDKFVYLACFFNPPDLFFGLAHVDRVELERPILNPHVTLVYKPKIIDTTLFGEKILVNVNGYGYNQYNEGLRVSMFAQNPALQELISKIEIPHITLSVSNGGKAVNTRSLDFSPIVSFDIIGLFGGYTYDGQIVYYEQK